MISIQRMKTLSIMASRLLVIAALLFSMCAVANAQEISDILFGQNNKEDYMGQYNYNGKRKNGFGIERYKNGAVYVGDFVENEISGRGMLISLKRRYLTLMVLMSMWVTGAKERKAAAEFVMMHPEKWFIAVSL